MHCHRTGQALAWSKNFAACLCFFAWALVSLFVLGGSARAQSVIYVDDSATGANDGSSWCDAFVYLQDALVAAEASGGTVTEIRVAQGTHKPDEGANQTPGDRTASFNLVNGVALRGGYAGCGAPDPNIRDNEVYETIMSGDLDENDIRVACTDDRPDCDLFGRLCLASFCIISGNNGENSYHVITGSGTNATAVLNGFTITAGNANATGAIRFGQTGAGMLSETGSPTVDSCTFNGNAAGQEGGGMSNKIVSNPTVTDCAFIGNSAADAGGMLNDNSSPTVTGCTFDGNVAANGSGGGMFNSISNPKVTNCAFNGNSATDYGGGIYNFLSSPMVTSSTFSGNLATQRGGGMSNNASNSIVTSCAFIGNSAASGGGMMNAGSSPTVTICTFGGNVAQFGAGMNNLGNSIPMVTSSTFSGNLAAQEGGGIWNGAASAPTVTNCTFTGNAASLQGGGVWFAVSSSPRVTNCILWNNSDVSGTGESAQIYVGAGWPVVSYSVVQGGWSGLGGVGIIDQEPWFTDPAGQDGIFGTQDDDLRLVPGSPGIDAGSNPAVPPDTMDLDGDGNTAEPTPFDLDGSPRFKDDPATPDTGVGTPPVVDMGAYEYQRGCLVSADCDNVNPCDGVETCISNVCEPGTPILCDDNNPCNGTESCNASGICVTVFDADCNANQIEDACDITNGAPDNNGNGVPDECEPGACCTGGGTCNVGLLSSCGFGSWSVGLDCEPNPCAFLMSAAPTGCRYFAVTPNPTGNPSTPIALQISSGGLPCMTKYVALDSGLGRLTDFPSYAPPGMWGEVAVADSELIPGVAYDIRAQTATAMSDPITVTLRRWGDVVEPWEQVSFVDISAAVSCFRHVPGAPPLSACDLAPAVPDQVVDFVDIAATVSAFQGLPYPYPSPCP